MNPIAWLLDRLGQRLVRWGMRLRGAVRDAAAPSGEAPPPDAKQRWLERVARVPAQAWQGTAAVRAPRPLALRPPAAGAAARAPQAGARVPLATPWPPAHERIEAPTSLHYRDPPLRAPPREAALVPTPERARVQRTPSVAHPTAPEPPLRGPVVEPARVARRGRIAAPLVWLKQWRERVVARGADRDREPQARTKATPDAYGPPPEPRGARVACGPAAEPVKAERERPMRRAPNLQDAAAAAVASRRAGVEPDPPRPAERAARERRTETQPAAARAATTIRPIPFFDPSPPPAWPELPAWPGPREPEADAADRHAALRRQRLDIEQRG